MKVVDTNALSQSNPIDRAIDQVWTQQIATVQRQMREVTSSLFRR